MNTSLKRVIFVIIIVVLIYINHKLNNVFKNSYINCIKYFFIGLGLLLMIFPNLDKDYNKLKSNIISK